MLGINLGMNKVVLMVHPDTAQSVLAEDVNSFDKAFWPIPPNKLSENSLISKNGDWKKQRATITPNFRYEYLVNISPIYREKAVVLLEEWKKMDNSVIDVKPWINKITLDVLGASVFGMEFNTLRGGSSAYETAYHKLLSYGGKLAILNLIPGIWKLKFLFKDLFSQIEQIQQMTLDIVNTKLQKRNQPDTAPNAKPDLLDGMLDHLTELSMDEILSNVWLFFIAGHETTSTSLCWSMYYFAKCPEFQETAREEVDRILEGKEPNHDNIKGLTFLDLFIKEVLRICPPAQIPAFPRVATKDVEIDGHIIAKDTQVNIGIDIIHHLEEFWPDHEKFDPYRFTPENSAKRHPYAYLPFSLGRRHCIANNFALMEIKIFLASLLQTFNMEYVEEPKVVNIIFVDTPESVYIRFDQRQPNSCTQGP